jgi:hypothetical protein
MVNSSRKLERVRSKYRTLAFVELFNYHSILISENKSIGIKNLFKLFVSFLKDADLMLGNHCYLVQKQST